jgi:uncharacterized protein (AIM24 family)
MRSNLFGENLETQQSQDVFTLQNSKMLKVNLNGDVMARKGSMVAYQGQVEFDHGGSGGLGRMLKKAITGEGLPLMKVQGRGDVFLASNADEVHLLHLDNDALTVNGTNILAFESTIAWDIHYVRGAGMMSGGAFNTLLQGTGWVAITCHGTPVVLQTDAPTFVDADAAVAWSANLQTRVHATVKLGALFGRSSGESIQMAFSGQGFVVVQASEGQTVPPHNHGNQGGGGNSGGGMLGNLFD